MSEEPLEMIEKYLERVRIYLPVDSQDTLTEIRTHLIEEAQSLGQGKITRGSVMLAIERFGDPKEAANAYAGTGKKVGIIPAEYVLPAGRMAMALVALVIAFGIGAYFVWVSLSLWGFPTIENWPFNIPVMIVFWVGLGVLVIGVLSFLDKYKAPTEKTVLEGVLGAGSGVFTPKSRTDAAGDIVFGLVFAVILLLPQIQLCFIPAFLPVVGVMAFLMAVGAAKGYLFFKAGENNANLLFEAVLSAAWIVACMVLVTTGWPIVYVWNNTNGVWSLFYLPDLYGDISFLPLLFNGVWTFIIFIVAVTNSWQLVISGMKIPMYMKAGKGWWWQGTWGSGLHSGWKKWSRRLFGRQSDDSAPKQSS
ncbi:MAG: hypothetical protein C4K49_11925 [Candidatus Thorarchaeota archaeon]|nr:MAG: hypothetical protein C4K49_11925 [Candidatus Thorarchaeota archaeon]